MNKIKLIIAFSLLHLFVSPANAQAGFFPLGSGLDFQMRGFYADTTDNLLYAIGNFNKAGGIVTNKIARWDGVQWDSLGSGVNDGGFPFAITKYNGEIYVGGSFNQIGGINAKKLAKWNGTNWTPAGDVSLGPLGFVSGLYVYNNELYVMGRFDTIAGTAANKIAKFDGNNWTSFPVLDPDGTYNITEAIFYNNELYVCGDFDGGPGLKDIAKFNGTNWESVGGGFSGFNTNADRLEIYNGELYVGGYFETAFGDPGNYLVKWNGSNWIQLPSETDWQIYDLKVYNNQLYVGGTFSDAGSVPQTAFAAAWNGTNWSSFGTFDNGVTAFAELNNELYIGGGFWTVNGDTMNYVTRYSAGIGLQEINLIMQNAVYPNPTTGIFVLRFEEKNNAVITLYDMLGNLVETSSVNNDTELSFDLSSYPKGMYLIKTISDNKLTCYKVIYQ